MKDINWITVLFVYIKNRFKIVLLFGVFFFIHILVFFLYNLLWEATAYAALLIIITFLLVAFYDFYHFYKKHAYLYTMGKSLNTHLENLPQPDNLLEQDYQDLLKQLESKRQELISQYDLKQADMMEYYTMWVHQIKTPISASYFILHANSDEPLAKELKQELFKIEQYAEMALQYLRIDHISNDLAFSYFPLASIIKHAVKKLSYSFIYKKITLHMDDIDCQVLTDEKWLAFVIEQILTNALKYTPKGSVSIYMDTEAEKTLVIEDTGIGIRKEDLPRIGERGFTGYNGHQDKKSSGLGLYLCKRILNKLSHKMTITSQISKGTRVAIDLSNVDIQIE